MRQEFIDFVMSPDRGSCLVVREAVISSDQYDPYSDEFEVVAACLEEGNFAHARNTIAESIPNLLLSPQEHLVLAMIMEKTGEEERASTERSLARAFVEGILATGNGLKENPYFIVRVSDEYDVLEYLGRPKEWLKATAPSTGRSMTWTESGLHTQEFQELALPPSPEHGHIGEFIGTAHLAVR